MIANKKVQVANGETPRADRFVSLSTARIFATDVYVVGVVDGTGHLAEPTSLLSTTDYERARRQANKLVQQAGGRVEPTHYAAHIAPEALGSGRAAYGLPPRQHSDGPEPFESTVIDPPKHTRADDWAVRWHVAGEYKRRGKRFRVEADAIAFHRQLTKEMD